MIQRGGQVILRMLANVQQATIKPVIEATVAKGSLIYTDEYNVYACLPGATRTRPSVTGRASMPATRMATGFGTIWSPARTFASYAECRKT